MKKPNWRQYDADLIGAGLLLAIAVVGYVLVIHRPLTDTMNYAAARRNHVEMTGAIASLDGQCRGVRQQIDATNRRLAAANSLLPEPDALEDLLARIDELASECGVVVARWQPSGTEKKAEYQIGTFLVVGTARFPALHRWFALIESGVPYLDVTHFSIRTGKDTDKPCHFACTMRFYTSPPASPQIAMARDP